VVNINDEDKDFVNQVKTKMCSTRLQLLASAGLANAFTETQV